MIPANVSNNQAVRIVGLSGKKDIYNADFSRERLGEYNKCETNDIGTVKKGFRDSSFRVGMSLIQTCLGQSDLRTQLVKKQLYW